jgi:hypothetical protein
VESILDHRGKGKKAEYLVKWKGYARNQSTWEPLSSFCSIELIHEYHAEQSNKANCNVLNSFKDIRISTSTSTIDSESDSDSTVESEDEADPHDPDADADADADADGDTTMASTGTNINYGQLKSSAIASGSATAHAVTVAGTYTDQDSTIASVTEPMGVVQCVSIPNQHPQRFIHSDCMVIIKALNSDWQIAKSKSKSNCKQSKEQEQSQHDHHTNRIANSEHHDHTNTSTIASSTSTTEQHHDYGTDNIHVQGQKDEQKLNMETLHPTLFHTVRGINYKFKE